MNVKVVYEERGILLEKDFHDCDSVIAAMNLLAEQEIDARSIIGVINNDEIDYIRKPYRASNVDE
ncbi:hypothetical protein [Emticicia sp. C21]|uniref:hypothetical protein n=1 Tax=Emticicia sp. C21 TaxID=2302915 RepID=UPI000E350264|nr:hypothetical protein [Emticicia sp. C21]RFS18341.1 hypothetical protein D0T08_03585 [Emticicia sp. C21]